MKKILIALPRLSYGGSERAATELANYFSVERNIETVILLMYSKSIDYDINDRVKVIEPPFRANKILKYLIPIYIITFLRKQIKKENPDAVLMLGYKTYTLIACLGLNVRVVDSLRTSPSRVRFPSNKLKNLVYNLVRKVVNYRVDGLIAQTERAKKMLEKFHACEVVRIPNSLRKIKDHQVEKKNIILSVGRLSIEKGHRFLLRAFAESGEKDWTVKFIGDGPQRDNLEMLSRELGIDNQVIFEGFQEDVDYYMQEAKIFVLPSLIEGFPNALLEAMANGLACVSFDCEAGPAELIDNGINGFLVEQENVKELADKLTALMSNNAKRVRMGMEAKDVIQEYDINIIGLKFIDFLLK